MPKFKIGQKVIALSPTDTLTMGAEYEVEGYTGCPHCGEETVYLVGIDTVCTSICTSCDFEEEQVRENFLEYRFSAVEEVDAAQDPIDLRKKLIDELLYYCRDENVIINCEATEEIISKLRKLNV